MPIREKVASAKAIVARATAPACECGTVPDGKSGNIKLDVKASYSPQKYLCKPNLRTFIYSDGPRFLTHVERLPDVPEIRRPSIRSELRPAGRELQLQEAI